MLPPRVDFYLLEETSPSEVEFMACRLSAKAYALEHRVFIYCQSREQAERMDALLWTFDESSFIPHALHTENTHPSDPQTQSQPISMAHINTIPILIGWETLSLAYQDVLINLSADISSITTGFNRVIELILNTELAKAEGRERYRYYRSQQCKIHMHSMR